MPKHQPAQIVNIGLPFLQTGKVNNVPTKYPSDLTSLSFQPDLTSQSAQKRRSPFDADRVIAEGVAFDWRLALRENWSLGCFERVRPVGPPEFEALFAAIVPLPGVPRPKQYGAMCCDFNKATRTLERWLYGVDKLTWRRLTEKYYSGSPAYFQPNWRHMGVQPPSAIYSDRLRAQTAGSV